MFMYVACFFFLSHFAFEEEPVRNVRRITFILHFGALLNIPDSDGLLAACVLETG